MAAGDTDVCLGTTRHSHPRSQPLVLCADRHRQYGLGAARRDASRHDGAMVHEARAGWADFVGAHAGIAKTLPSTQGIIVLRRVILDGQSLAAVWQDGSLGWLILHSVLYFGGGLLIFRLWEQIAKRRGSLGQY